MDSNITYDVRLFKIEVYQGVKVTTYWVRWQTGSQRWKEPFRRKTQAASFQAELRAAAGRGEAFDLATGRPVSWVRRGNDMSWYDFCVCFVDMKWKDSSAHHRANIAWALVTVTPAMIKDNRNPPGDAKQVRAALRQWGFNTVRRRDCPAEAAAILTWLSRNTRPASDLADPATMRAVLSAAGTLLDGSPAASSNVHRNRAILHNALDYAVERSLLSSNPLEDLKSKAPRTASEVDRRCVVSHAQARRLLAAVGEQMPSGPRLVAFFAVIYYAALRPEEAASLREDNIILPPLVRNEVTGELEEPADGWGELHFCTATTEVGMEWTDDGRRRDHRQQLKSRAAGEWRHVPVAPQLTRLLRAHLKQFGTGPGGRVFSGVYGGELASVTYRRVWHKARKAALTPAEYDSPLARRPYDLRHAAVSTWLNGGVAPAQVAEWAGHSVAVLLKVYAKCVDGQDHVARQRIADALRETGEPPGRGPAARP